MNMTHQEWVESQPHLLQEARAKQELLREENRKKRWNNICVGVSKSYLKCLFSTNEDWHAVLGEQILPTWQHLLLHYRDVKVLRPQGPAGAPSVRAVQPTRSVQDRSITNRKPPQTRARWSSAEFAIIHTKWGAIADRMNFEAHPPWSEIQQELQKIDSARTTTQIKDKWRNLIMSAARDLERGDV